MNDKLCIWCEHCALHIDGYDTSGYYPMMDCEKGHWSGGYSSVPGKPTMLMAVTCKDYVERKE